MSFKRTRCPHCKGKLEQGQRIHHDCIAPWAEAQEAKAQRAAEKKARMQAKVEKAEIRQRKEAIKGIPQLIKEAQEAFNAFIRERDKDKGCFVCGAPFASGWLGGSYDAGHVRSRGAAGHLRFNEDNCHGECKSCNAPTGAKPHEIKAGAIRRIGQERYYELEADNEPRKWTHDELRAIRDLYRAKLKELKRGSLN